MQTAASAQRGRSAQPADCVQGPIRATMALSRMPAEARGHAGMVLVAAVNAAVTKASTAQAAVVSPLLWSLSRTSEGCCSGHLPAQVCAVLHVQQSSKLHFSMSCNEAGVTTNNGFSGLAEQLSIPTPQPGETYPPFCASAFYDRVAR